MFKNVYCVLEYLRLLIKNSSSVCGAIKVSDKNSFVQPFGLKLLILMLCFGLSNPAQAQFPSWEPGLAVVSTFSGSRNSDSDGYVLSIIDVSGPYVQTRFSAYYLGRYSENWFPATYNHSSWTAGNMGEIFGVDIAYEANSDIYISSFGMPHSWHGLGPISKHPSGTGGDVMKITSGGNGTPVKIASLPNTVFNYGTGGGNGAGFDAFTGLGQISYNNDNDVVYVSNLDNGLIYILTTSGAIQSTYDHGASLSTPITDDAANLFTDLDRMIWGLEYNFRDDKLYYAAKSTSDESQIWSVDVLANGDLDIATKQVVYTDSNSALHVYTGGVDPINLYNFVSDIEFNSTGNDMMITMQPLIEADNTVISSSTPTLTSPQTVIKRYSYGTGSNSLTYHPDKITYKVSKSGTTFSNRTDIAVGGDEDGDPHNKWSGGGNSFGQNNWDWPRGSTYEQSDTLSDDAIVTTANFPVDLEDFYSDGALVVSRIEDPNTSYPNLSYIYNLLPPGTGHSKGTFDDVDVFREPMPCKIQGTLDATCNNGGTPTDPSDDTYTYNVLADVYNDYNNSTMYNVSGDDIQTGLDYESAHVLGPFPVTPGLLSLTLTDDIDDTCTGVVETLVLSCATTTCSVVITGEPKYCMPNGTYTFKGQVDLTNAPTTGTMTISDGAVSQTYNAPFVSDPQHFELSGLPADDLQHELIVTFSDDTSCGGMYEYYAPPGCDSDCDLNILIFSSSNTCNGSTYNLQFIVQNVDPLPVAGGQDAVITVYNGNTVVYTETYPASGGGNITDTYSNLPGNGNLHTIVVEFANEIGCYGIKEYTAPSCGNCSSSVTAIAGECDLDDNTYAVSGQITLSNPPSSGNMIIAIGSSTQIISAPFSGVEYYNISGLNSDGASHTVDVSFSAVGTCTSSTNYSAPAECLSLGCSSSITTVPGACDGANDEYALTGSVTFNSAPSSGTLTVSVTGGGNQVFDMTTTTSPVSYNITGLTSDGASHTVTTEFSADSDCNNNATYTAPAACIVDCDHEVVLGTPVCNGTTYDIEVTITGASGGASLQLAFDGVTEQTFTSPLADPIVYTITGLVADGLEHTIQAGLFASVKNVCNEYVTFTAPASCSTNPCSSSVTATAGTCDPGTNLYTVSGSITFSDEPSSGTLTVNDGAGGSQVFNTPFTSPQAYSITGLSSDGVSHTITAVFSADDPSCTSTVDYTAPASCTPNCSSTVTAVTGICASATNEYTLTGVVNFSNAPSTGTITVTVDGETDVITLPTTSPASYSIAGLTSDGASHTVTVVFSEDGVCDSTVDYTAPANCTPSCSGSITATASVCTPATNEYTASGEVSWTDGPTTGTITVTVDGQTDVINLPTTSPASWNIGGLTSDGVSHTASVVFSADGNCDAMAAYTAPASCTPNCSSTVTAVTGICASATNEYTLTGVVNFSNAPSTGTITVTVDGETDVITLPTTSPASYSIAGLTSDGASHTVTVVFSEDSDCDAMATYTAPANCTLNCSITVTSATPTICNSVDNLYDLAVVVTYADGPGGDITLTTSGGLSETFNSTGTSPEIFTFTDIMSDGAQNLDVTATFDDDTACTMTNSGAYNAPTSCIVLCPDPLCFPTTVIIN